MDSCVGEVQKRNLSSKRPSKPVEVMDYESQIKNQIQNKISTQCDFKIGSDLMNVSKVSDKRIFTLRTGDFLDSSKENWNSCFEGEATLYISNENGYTPKRMKICGFAQIGKEKLIEISPIISCYNIH